MKKNLIISMALTTLVILPVISFVSAQSYVDQKLDIFSIIGLQRQPTVYSGKRTWTIVYDGSVLPEHADPPWNLEYLLQPGYVSTDGEVLTIRTTNEEERTEAYYKMWDIVNRTNGITVQCRVKIGYIGNDESIPDTSIGITDSTQAFYLDFLEDRILDHFNPDNYYSINTKKRFHVYRITSKNGITKVYVNGIYRLTLTGNPYSLNYVRFGDGRGQYEGMNGESNWDYVKINTNGAFPPIF